ncbi:MAG: Rieske 2Fe-2S domain-containing protein, partial [Alphaproteobacteria bacterium]|nr:Rieske 2Fe-2S domain-containing protein [Alphaproteobacteria bacterium]
MPDTRKTPPQQLPENPQQLVNFMTNEEWYELLGQVDALVREMDDLPYPNVKEKIFTLLAGIDTIHRESLGRLVRLFKQGVLEKVVTDPTIHTLMELYDLLPPEVEQAEGKKVDEQLAKIQLATGPGKGASVPTHPQEVQKQSPSKYPHWVPVLQQRDDLLAGAVKNCQVEDHSILLCRVEDSYFAVAAACAEDNTLMADGELNKYTLTCPNHPGCYYDVRNGGRMAGTAKIECYPVKQDDNGRVLVGMGMPFEPKL